MTLSLQENVAVAANPGLSRYSTGVTGGVLHVVESRNVDGEFVGSSSAFAPSGVSASMSPSTITTNGAGALITADLLGGLIIRSGATSAFTDTTDSAATIQATWAGSTGSSFEFTIVNTTAFVETIAAGAGVTLSGNVTIPGLSAARFLAVWTGASAITITNESVSGNGGLPAVALTALNATTGSLAAGKITGASSVVMISSNATPGAQLVRTAAQMLADIPNGQIGMSWELRITNTGAGTLTLTADSGATVTLTGTMTVPQNTFRDFICTINTATTATITAVGTGTYS
jgi:hypothetical protein